MRDSQFQVITPGADFRRKPPFCFVANEIELMSAQAIELRSFFGFLDRTDTTEPIGRGAKAVAVVVDKRMFRSEATFRLIEFGGTSRRDEVSLQE